MTYPKDKVENLKKFWKNYGQFIIDYGKVPARASNGVGSNTYRAYGRFIDNQDDKVSPSSIFNLWVDIDWERISRSSPRNFADLHAQALKSLVTRWKRESSAVLPVYPYATKLIDLFFKHIAWHHVNLPVISHDQLLNYLYQPLDKYSLQTLRLFNIQVDGRNIPSAATMGFVDNEERYQYLQGAIAEICGAAGVPRFAFDHFAWNAGIG
jgi:hypothetical protein